MVRISRLTGRFLFILTPVNNSSGGFQFSISFIIAAVTKIKKHGRLSMSLFRYGLDYVQMAIQSLIGFGKKEEFKEILAILRRQNPDRIRVL